MSQISPVDKFHLIQAFCGDMRIHNIHRWEAPFYGLWACALATLFPGDRDDSFVCIFPQLPFSKDQVDDSGDNPSPDDKTAQKKVKTIKKVPDFSLLYLKGQQAESPGTDILSEIFDEDLLADHFRGQYSVTDFSVLILCEIKGFPELPDPGDFTKEKYAQMVADFYYAKFAEAQDEASQQASMLFAEHDQLGVVLFTGVGRRLSWANCPQSAVSIVSDHVDPSHRRNTVPRRLGKVYIPSENDKKRPYLRPVAKLKARFGEMLGRKKKTKAGESKATIQRAEEAPDYASTAAASTEGHESDTASTSDGSASTDAEGRSGRSASPPVVDAAETSGPGPSRVVSVQPESSGPISARAAEKQPARDPSPAAHMNLAPSSEKLQWSPHIPFYCAEARLVKDDIRAAVRAWNPNRDF
ncbi:hypothetical protein B0H21DRAFT_748279 [Amylocystis lapponica]|nr:hypothetical protein B0H21DRAFT_748279 [Amylocystis lapponica]